ncbi:AraC family transcriptional regulator [Nonomuraea sp. NPDC049486]|uniref:AraC family transcriptional regulator n=1 Tax=Nonomuraea sp. NPDC049486 TaxID=3155773 RepID=UPI0034155E04
MDVLSDAVTAARVGRPHSSRLVGKVPFAADFPAGEGCAGFHVVLQGSCLLLPREADPVPLAVGDVVFLPTAAAHGLASAPAAPPGGTVVLLCGGYPMDQDRVHPLLTELPEIVHLPAKVGRDPSLQAVVELLAQELDRAPTTEGDALPLLSSQARGVDGDGLPVLSGQEDGRVPALGGGAPGGDAALPALLDLLLLYILRAWLAEQSGGWAGALRDPAVDAALRAVHGDLARPWTVEALGRQGGLSRAAFARRFAALVGRPPLAYLTWWRLTSAARLLRDTDEPLTAIAAQVGYGSEHALAHAFKREYGLAPGAYRRTTPSRNPVRTFRDGIGWSEQ